MILTCLSRRVLSHVLRPSGADDGQEWAGSEATMQQVVQQVSAGMRL